MEESENKTHSLCFPNLSSSFFVCGLRSRTSFTFTLTAATQRFRDEALHFCPFLRVYHSFFSQEEAHAFCCKSGNGVCTMRRSSRAFGVFTPSFRGRSTNVAEYFSLVAGDQGGLRSKADVDVGCLMLLAILTVFILRS